MEQIPKGLYTPEFRVEAVKLAEEKGLSVDAAAKRLSVPKSSLGNWVRASRKGKLATVGQGQRVPTEAEMEPARLRKELAEVKLERDLLKKMCGVFCEGVAVKYARIDALRPHHPVATIMPHAGSIGKRLSRLAATSGIYARAREYATGN